MITFCPECGFGVAVDEDGCCVSCGCDATGPAVDELPEPCLCQTVIYHKGYICKDCRKAAVEVDAGERMPVQMPVQATVLDNGVVIDEGE